MKSKRNVGICSLDYPVSIDFVGLDIVEQVVEEAFVKEPKKGLRRKA